MLVHLDNSVYDGAIRDPQVPATCAHLHKSTAMQLRSKGVPVHTLLGSPDPHQHPLPSQPCLAPRWTPQSRTISGQLRPLDPKCTREGPHRPVLRLRSPAVASPLRPSHIDRAPGRASAQAWAHVGHVLAQVPVAGSPGRSTRRCCRRCLQMCGMIHGIPPSPGMHWKGGIPPPPSRPPGLCPATVSLAASARFSGICNRQ